MAFILIIFFNKYRIILSITINYIASYEHLKILNTMMHLYIYRKYIKSKVIL
jgi:hypothetical protein